ncbi:uncharacterized protein LOC132198015 [Neocloeon triangulifer]|uniref:uncharacterized protein LOC132198015 n=1 Tax=Neocloeon triangulifer TaxID=2078957 RepID=UPI00286F812E|nr:uncharacterized protein LOC132198015 [Neocloeon triangulifer]
MTDYKRTLKTCASQTRALLTILKEEILKMAKLVIVLLAAAVLVASVVAQDEDDVSAAAADVELRRPVRRLWLIRLTPRPPRLPRPNLPGDIPDPGGWSTQ